MGLLDDLKRQAAQRAAQQQDDTAQWERNAALVEAASQTVFKYWLELVNQLKVIKPASRVRYVLDARHVFEDLAMSDFHVDARRKTERGQSVHDYVQLTYLLKSGRALVICKDMPPEIEKLRARLRLSGIQHQLVDVREPESGRYLHTRFEFTADFLAGLKLLPQHAAGTVQFKVFNVEGFETLQVETRAAEVTQALLDELARLVLGESNRFAQMTRVLRRG